MTSLLGISFRLCLRERTGGQVKRVHTQLLSFKADFWNLQQRWSKRLFFEPQKYFQVSNKIMMLLVAFVPYIINLKACEIGQSSLEGIKTYKRKIWDMRGEQGVRWCESSKRDPALWPSTPGPKLLGDNERQRIPDKVWGSQWRGDQCPTSWLEARQEANLI